MDANKLAHELHRRRLSLSANAPRHAAAGVARFCENYGYEPTLDDFDHYLDLYISTGKETMTVVTADSGQWTVDTSVVQRTDYVVFTSGSKLAETEVVGWLPSKRVMGAPHTGRADKFSVDERCLFPMPMVLDFEPEGRLGFSEPEIDVPGIWSYELHALWTPLGFHVYDQGIANLVYSADKVRAGRN